MRAFSHYDVKCMSALLSELRALANASQERRIDEMLKRLTRLKAPKRGVSQRRGLAREKKAQKREKTAEIRNAVVLRANGRCEFRFQDRGLGRCSFAGTEMDHFFGRARAESVETCWLLCPQHHLHKTRNVPTAAYWFTRFIAHCEAMVWVAHRAIDAAPYQSAAAAASVLLKKHEAKSALDSQRAALGRGGMP